MTFSENYSNSFKLADSDRYKIEDITLKPCPICGRTFNHQSLERHVKVCEKTKKCIRRNVFNSFSQRAKDLGAVSKPSNIKEKERKKCKKSKDDHSGNVLFTAVNNKSSNSSIMNNGLSPNNKLPAGYQQCPSCSRYFNQKAAERHIAWCMEQKTRLPKTPPSSEALERLKARTKYKAPAPKKKVDDSNIRLVKSADSTRESLLLRTHSSPQIPVGDLKTSRFENHLNAPNVKPNSPMKVDKNTSMCLKNKNYHEQSANDGSKNQNKKTVKFKEIFPVYKKERNKNLDMLAALRIQLSQLGTSTSDDLLDDSFLKPNENDPFHNQSKGCNFLNSAAVSKGIWSGDYEARHRTSNSSDDSLPSVNQAGISNQRIPRFCYNCGTKYPIVSAKFCCECGARRFILGVNNDQLYAV